MRLPQRARLLLSGSLSGCPSFRRSGDVPVEISERHLPAPFPSHKPSNPVALVSNFRSVSMRPDLSPRFRGTGGCRRGLCGAGPPAVEDYSKEVDDINLKFVEAREEIDAAMESKDTVYFDEEAECAREAVKVVLDMFRGLLSRLPEKERAALQRSMGLKIEQLKAELEQLND